MTPSPPSIDILIMTYRRPHTLKRTIESLLRQTYKHFNIFVYDDASNDETGDVVSEYVKKDNRVHYYCHRANVGMTKNYNFALARTKAPFFSIQSDDDYFHHEALQNAVAEFAKYPESTFVALNTTIVNQTGKIVRKPWINNLLAGYYHPPAGLMKMLQVGVLCWSGIIFRNELITLVGPLSENQEFAIDLDYLVRICAHYPFYVSTKPGIFFTEHDSNTSAICKFDWIWPCYLDIIHLIADDVTISAEIRRKCTDLLLERLRKRLVYTFIASLQRNDKHDSERTIAVLENYFASYSTAKILKIMNKTYYFSPSLFSEMVNLVARNKPRIVWFLNYWGNFKYNVLRKDVVVSGEAFKRGILSFFLALIWNFLCF